MVLLQQGLPTLKSESFYDYFHTVVQEVENTLEIILPPPTTSLHKAMRYSVLGGGKRLRSFLVWESCKLFGVSSKNALNTAAAVELIQTYSLVHDDLPSMDNADLRRGKPSCHKVFGEATAILVGDALIPLAFQTLSSLEAPPDLCLKLINHLSHTVGSCGLVAGQMQDLGYEKPCQNYEDLWELQQLKTALFFAFASESGAVLGNASSQEREALYTYGLLLGQAFQMMDDWLDGCGNEETMGKPVLQDTSKLTFFSLLGPELLYKKTDELIQEACETLTPFQEKAFFLKEAALYVLNRKR